METKICSCCGKELPITDFAIRGVKGHKGKTVITSVCKSCMADKVAHGRNKAVDKAKEMRLQDFTPRELMQELARRGYEGKLRFVQVQEVDITNF